MSTLVRSKKGKYGHRDSRLAYKTPFLDFGLLNTYELTFPTLNIDRSLWTAYLTTRSFQHKFE